MKHIIVSSDVFGQTLKAVRKGMGLTQKETGEKIGADQATISTIENGNPGTRLDTILHLLAALDLEMIIQSRGKSAQKNSGDHW